MTEQTQRREDLRWGGDSHREGVRQLRAIDHSVAVMRLTKKFASLKELIAHLNGLTTILCGKVHEKGESERTAFSCPIQTRNLSCAHAVGQLLSDTVKLAVSFGKISSDEADQLLADLESISKQIYEVDVSAFNLYKRGLEGVPDTITAAETELGAKRGVIRDRLVEALDV